MPQTVFKRYEKKYLLNNEQAKQVINMLQPYMQQDDYGLHTICSLYFDTDDNKAFINAEKKTMFREKMRVRSYGVPKEDDIVFLELKKKFDGITYKRRIPLTLKEVKRYIKYGLKPENDSQIFGEIDWFMQKEKVKPRVIVCYDRIAMDAIENEGLRITFDSNIRWRKEDLDLGMVDAGCLLAEDNIVMEIKIPDAMPVWLSAILSEEKVYPVSFSKFKTAFANNIIEENSKNKYFAQPIYYPNKNVNKDKLKAEGFVYVR